MALITLAVSGTAVIEATNPAVTCTYPAAGIQNNDIAIMVVGANSGATTDTGTDLATGFTKFGFAGTGGTGSAVICGWKRCDGSENGGALSIDFSTGTITKYLQILIYRGCITTGSPIEAGAVLTDAVGATSVTMPNVTTTGADRRVIMFSSRRAGNTVTNLPVAGFDTDSYNDISASLDCVILGKEVVAAATINGAVLTYPTSSVCAATGFALIPASSASIVKQMLLHHGG
jgi:hypothetical protein